jgi:hypothetical protein
MRKHASDQSRILAILYRHTQSINNKIKNQARHGIFMEPIMM